MSFHYEGGTDSHTCACSFARVCLCLCVFCTKSCCMCGGGGVSVCLHLVGWERRQRLGESYRETLQGLERMLIKASYSTASSFLTVPAAGSTTLCFLATSSLLSLYPLPSISVSLPVCVSPALSPHLPFWKLGHSRCFDSAVDSDRDARLNIYYFSRI